MKGRTRDDMGPDAFEAALRDVGGVEGWLTDDQARLLWERARGVEPPGRVVEIGSFRGRSTIMLARGAGRGVEVFAVDPHAGNDRGPREISGPEEAGREDHGEFTANLAAAGVADRVEHLDLTSEAALAAISGPVELLYVDGAHRYSPARHDLERWGDRVAPGGTMLVHDAWSAVGVWLAQIRLLVFGRRFRYVGRRRTMAEYRREDLHGTARLRNVARQLAEFGFAARTQIVKVLLVLRLRRAAGWLGHPAGDPWPY